MFGFALSNVAVVKQNAIKRTKGDKMSEIKQSLANEWLTPKQLQAEIGISLRTQEKLRTKTCRINSVFPLPYSKIGRNVLYNRAEINEWLAKNKVVSDEQ